MSERKTVVSEAGAYAPDLGTLITALGAEFPADADYHKWCDAQRRVEAFYAAAKLDGNRL